VLAKCNIHLIKAYEIVGKMQQPTSKQKGMIIIVPSRVIRDKPRKKNKYNSTVMCNRDCLKAKVGRIG
jgi:hypothetical protein